MKNKANRLKQCGFRAAMVNMLKRGFFFLLFVCWFVFGEWGTGNVAARSRHQKKALWFQTEHPPGSTLPAWRKVPAVCRGSIGGHNREECASCRCGGWLPLSKVLTFQCLEYNSSLSPIPLKTNPASNDFGHFLVVFFSCLAPQESLLVVCRLPCVFSVHGKKKKTGQNVSFFFSEWTPDTETWRSLQQTKWNRDRSDCQISKLSPRVCLYLIVVFLSLRHPSFCLTVRFTSGV